MKVGITGHQNLGSEEDIAWIATVLVEQIDKYNATHGFTCLAVGADQLFASVLRERGIKYTAIIPCEGYETTFDEETLKTYRLLLDSAADTLQLPYSKPEEIAFWEAGKRLVEMTDVLIAIWNGAPAKGLGGTGDVVAFSVEKGKTVVHINNVDHSVSVLDRK